MAIKHGLGKVMDSAGLSSDSKIIIRAIIWCLTVVFTFGVGAASALWAWHFENFITTAEAETLRELVTRNTNSITTHNLEYKSDRKWDALQKIQTEINNTNDKLWSLAEYADDSRKYQQEKEYKNRLESLKLLKNCIEREEKCD